MYTDTSLEDFPYTGRCASNELISKPSDQLTHENIQVKNIKICWHAFKWRNLLRH